MNIQEDNIEPLMQESISQNSEQVMEEEPLNQISKISFSAEKDCNQNLMSDLKYILDIGHSKSKIEITLTDLEPALIKQVKSEQNRFSQINPKFQANLQKPLDNLQLSQKRIHLIDPMVDQLNEQSQNQLLERLQDKVTTNIDLILFHWRIITNYFMKSMRADVNAQVILAESQSNVNSITKETNIFVKMKSDLASLVILMKECQSDEEAIFAIIKVNDLQINSIKDLQEEFTKFIDDSKNVKRLEDQQIFQLVCLPNLIQIKKQIESANIYGCEIEISEPNMDYETSKYQIEISHTLWYPGVMQITNGQQMMNQIKNQIFQIFYPIVCLTLKDKDQIEIWYDCLNRQYEINCDEITITTVRNTEDNEIEIRLAGCVDKCMIMKEQIKKELDEIESKVIVLQYQTTISNFNCLVKTYTNQFKKQLELIQQEYADLKIQIVNFNTDSKKIEFKVQYKSNLTYDHIKQILQDEFIQQIQFYAVVVDLPGFLQFLKLDINDFEEGYATIVGKMDDKYIFSSTEQFFEPIKDLINQFEQVTQQQLKTVLIKFDSYLLLKKLQQMIQTEQIKIQEDVKCNFILTSIQLIGPEESVLKSQSMIIDFQQQLKSQLLRRPLDLSNKEVNFIIKNINLDEYLKQFECEIKVSSDKRSYRNQIASTLSYQGRELNIAYADISQFECQAIVNSCNHIMSFEYVDVLSKVSRKIFDMAGPSYTKFCQKYIQEHKTLECGKAITYKMPNLNNGVQNYIINVSIPIYQNEEYTNQDHSLIEQIIKAIFIEANNLNITTIALSILNGGICGYSLKQIVQNTLIHIINNLYSADNQTVQIVDVVELEEIKLIQICQSLQKIIRPSDFNRQIKYQWQWIDGNIYKDYDNEEINKQIDEEFEQFKNQKQNRETRELQLTFPFTKQPGTHLVNLKTMQITDITLGTKIQLSLQKIEEKQRFLFGDLQIDDDINEYLILQKLVNHLEFQIFYKKYKIIFNSNGAIKQINESTGFSRNVRAIPYQKSQQQKTQNILIGKNVKFESKFYDKQLNKQSNYQILVESLDLKVIEDIQNLIETEINERTINHIISLPLIKEEEFNHLQKFIKDNSVKVDSDIMNGENLTVRMFKGQQLKIQSQIDDIISKNKKYPKNWIYQNKNLIKVDLSNNSEEHQLIQSEFQKTDNGKISKIFRLQNQRLWENYQLELQKLQILSLKRNTTLTQLEQGRFLWYGVKEQPPNKIYGNMKQIFKSSQKDKYLLGQGIHFFEQANDLRDDSYKLTERDDPENAGKLVFICCQVMTGKIHSTNPETIITRPPNGYDCVRKLTGGSSIFILYGVDVKRVYPAYEIIYE